jgi:hypothetical protein
MFCLMVVVNGDGVGVWERFRETGHSLCSFDSRQGRAMLADLSVTVL